MVAQNPGLDEFRSAMDNFAESLPTKFRDVDELDKIRERKIPLLRFAERLGVSFGDELAQATERLRLKREKE